ncbi:5-carboxymethyl-2-hydroxymuconate isomerase [Herbaspirillum sp. Sphag1AN]|uniref:5-carboxymethyl-2-hydroxymuconate Delta-isomerase n=1 Tax=unclassified Herbaspirillum TaxID=2624150 RepID=UPI00160E752B|nr:MULTISPECIES: 5-carboxymethyl-2-hydroxymuconate Delta-isomerase [unclassified Herbaspirillum]MBB3213897.1 5-carboxymethyl-2-hydroxymuconate isomerase [Herbaspirillum sp. Sphag1AN]MBB3247094.1 5-carboxymethyl-2-hydroxymuconate isomerase [Herbaspirillum sp. Sphag64]
MPHVTLEYTDNLISLDTRKILLKLNTALAASGHFEEEDIKSRSIKLDDYVVGTSAEQKTRGFLNVRLAILSGRTDSVKKQLSEIAIAEARDFCQGYPGMRIQLSVEVVDIDRSAYSKLFF